MLNDESRYQGLNQDGRCSEEEQRFLLQVQSYPGGFKVTSRHGVTLKLAFFSDISLIMRAIYKVNSAFERGIGLPDYTTTRFAYRLSQSVVHYVKVQNVTKLPRSTVY